MGLVMFSQGSLKWQIIAFIIHYKKAGGGFLGKTPSNYIIVTLSKSYLILNSSNFSNF